MDFREAQFPRHTCMLDGGPTSGPCPSVIAGDEDVVSLSLGYTSSNGANPCFRTQFYGHAGMTVDILKVMDEFCQIFDRIDIMMWWRRYQFNTWCGVTGMGDIWRYLTAWQLAPFPWLSPLGTLDLQFLSMNQVVCGDPKTTRCYLFYLGVHGVPIRQWHKARCIFPAFTWVGCTAQAIHSDSDGFMGFLRDGPKGHSPRFKAFHDGFYRFYFFYGDTAPFRQVEFHKGPKCYMVIILDILGIYLILLIVIIDKRFLEFIDSGWVIEMFFPVLHWSIETTWYQSLSPILENTIVATNGFNSNPP